MGEKFIWKKYEDYYTELKDSRDQIEVQKMHGGGENSFGRGYNAKSIGNIAINRAVAMGEAPEKIQQIVWELQMKYKHSIVNENNSNAVTQTDFYHEAKAVLDKAVKSGEMSQTERSKRLYIVKENMRQEKENAKAQLLFLAHGDWDKVKGLLDLDMHKLSTIFESISLGEMVLRMNRATSTFRHKRRR